MNEKSQEYWGLAREALVKKKYDDAALFYEAAFIADKDNANLEIFWYVGYALLKKKDPDGSEYGPSLKYLCSHFTKMLSSIEKEPKELHEFMVVHMCTAYETMIEMAFATRWRLEALSSIKKVGDEIIKIFGEKEPYTTLALRMWKQAIFMRHSYCAYRNFQDKKKETWYDEMIKKIQKYDPNYAAPKFIQAGCVMFGDKGQEASKVSPGF